RSVSTRTPRTKVEDMRTLFALIFVAAVTSAIAAAQRGPGGTVTGPERFAMRVVTSGLDSPWEVTWGPDDQLWVTERRGRRVLRIDPASGATSVILTMPDVHQSVTQDGLLGMTLHPGLLR